MIPSVADGWCTEPRSYDILHYIACVLRCVRTKDTPLYNMFAHALACCIFRTMDGEHDRVMKYLMSKPENKGKSRESVQAATRRQYFRKHERKVCPEPVVMMRSIVDLFKVFSKAKNPKTGYTFLSSGWRSVLTKELKYVAKGYLSDKPDISYYTKLPTKLGQLQEFRCNRGNSALEGYHVHLRRRGQTS